MTARSCEVVAGATLAPEAIARPKMTGGLVGLRNKHRDVVDLHTAEAIPPPCEIDE